MKRLRVGLLGCGGIGARHAAAVGVLNDEMQLVACCGRNESRVREFAARFGAASFTDLRRMLDSRIELLIVALPPFAHSGQVEQAVAAGTHVLVEKPIALDMTRAQSMVDAAETAGVVAACGFMYRFGAAVQRWDAAAKSGETGGVGLFTGQFHCNALHADWWRERAKSGGQMVEQLIHIVDLARHQLGEPQSVYARTANFFHRDVAGYDSDDVSAIVLGYADGRVGLLNATNGAVPGQWNKLWQIVAERMTGRFTGWNTATLTHTVGTPRTEEIDAQTDVFVAQLADVAAAIRDKRPPSVPLSDGASTLRIVLAARQSAAEGREVPLSFPRNSRNAADRGRRTMTGQTLSAGGVELTDFAPLIDGVVPACEGPKIAKRSSGWTLAWSIGAQRFVVEIETEPMTLKIVLEGVAGGSIDSLGLRIGRAANVVRYLRNGYTSWDGSFFVELDSARGIIAADPTAAVGYAMTALVSEAGETAVLGFLRHDRFQSGFRFAFAEGPLSIDVETLIDGSVRGERIEAEPLILLSGVDVEETLREWARRVVQAAPLPPRIHGRRIAGWCSWYNLYASITEPIILEHLAAAAQFRDRHQVPFDVFQIDDGFTPEMGDWLDVKPQFPRGMKPLLADIRAKGFTPGLWIAPFMIGNRSRLYAEHPDWVVADRTNGKPIAPMTFYGEFRWHKRSEEYYVLDITHPAAEAYVRKVFRTWARDWGCGYFKTDFMFFGSDYGPREARWHVEGLSRIEIWMRMARLIREEIGDAPWLGCGGPIWAGVGLLDAVRIGRDVGVSWEGHYSAQSLLRDQTSRNFGNGIFWQSDPDCVLLRDRFHHLTDEQVGSLALFAGFSGGVLMTSDRLDEISDERARLFADLARESRPQPCDFPQLGRVPLRHRIGTSHTGAPKLMSEGDPVLIQRVRKPDGTVVVALLNAGSTPADREIDGVRLSLPPYAMRMLPRQ